MGANIRPTPTKLKLLRGNPGKQRLNRSEPQFKSGLLPEPPAFLCKLAKQEWRRLAPELHRLGLLTLCDLNSFAAYAQAFAHWVEAEELLTASGKTEFTLQTTNGNTAYNPLVSISAAAARDMVKFACEFGGTPASRSRIVAAEAEP